MSKDFTVDPQFPDCPVRNVLSRICSKWSIIIVSTLGNNGRAMRHSELERAIPDISQKVLTATLRTLVADGIVQRQQYDSIPPRVEYSLTERGRTLLPHINSLTDWAYDNLHAILVDRAAGEGWTKK